jgi:hypothetical protein
MNSTWISVAGLIVATAVTILDKFTEEITKQKKWLRNLWFLLVLAGLTLSVYGAYRSERDSTAQTSAAAAQASQDNAAISALTSSVQQIPNNAPQFQQIEDDLNLLIAHAGVVQPQIRLAQPAQAQTQYLVQIAASTSSSSLQPYLANLQKRFGPSTDAAILEPRPGSKQCLLVWGQHLDQATANARAKAADALHLPPPGQSAIVATQY